MGSVKGEGFPGPDVSPSAVTTPTVHTWSSIHRLEQEPGRLFSLSQLERFLGPGACHRCRMMHIGCDRKLPSCSRCRAKGCVCEYLPFSFWSQARSSPVPYKLLLQKESQDSVTSPPTATEANTALVACSLAVAIASTHGIVAYGKLDPRAASSDFYRKCLWFQLFDEVMCGDPISFDKLVVRAGNGECSLGCYIVMRFFPTDFFRTDGVLPLQDVFRVLHMSPQLTQRLGWTIEGMWRYQLSFLHLVHSDDLLTLLQLVCQGICWIFSHSLSILPRASCMRLLPVPCRIRLLTTAGGFLETFVFFDCVLSLSGIPVILVVRVS